MIVVMQAHCKDEAIEHVMQFLDVHGLSGHRSPWRGRSNGDAHNCWWD